MLNDREEKKNQILEKSFDLFVKQGLENTSLNDLALYCNTYKAAFYAHFKSKDEVVIESAKMYMLGFNNKISKLLSNPAYNLIQLLEECLSLITMEKNKIRYTYQIISSPKLGEVSRKSFSPIYTEILDFSYLISKKYRVDYDKFRPYYLMLIATICDYCLWDDEITFREKCCF